jgi:hypothetical protein
VLTKHWVGSHGVLPDGLSTPNDNDIADDRDHDGAGGNGSPGRPDGGSPGGPGGSVRNGTPGGPGGNNDKGDHDGGNQGGAPGGAAGGGSGKPGSPAGDGNGGGPIQGGANGTGGTDGGQGSGTPANFGVTDTSTGASFVTAGDAYNGPVTELQRECIMLTNDNTNITAYIPNVFVHSDGGEDALQVLSGTNVLDGSTGSNFLVGGTGTDTFFVDDRGPTADIWSTVVGIHGGDSATVWGVTPQDFKFSWVDDQGASGFTGLTLHATAAGKPIASLTLAGFTSDDLNNGRLSITFGHTGDLPGLAGSDYMQVHAN